MLEAVWDGKPQRDDVATAGSQLFERQVLISNETGAIQAQLTPSDSNRVLVRGRSRQIPCPVDEREARAV